MGQSALAKSGGSKATGHRRAVVTLELAGTAFDPQNAVANLKPHCDGLVDAGCLAGDTEELLTLEVRQRRVIHKGTQRSVWEISE